MINQKPESEMQLQDSKVKELETLQENLKRAQALLME
jgi:hypothetical protein